jgi:hypothetical protein
MHQSNCIICGIAALNWVKIIGFPPDLAADTRPTSENGKHMAASLRANPRIAA